MTLRCSNGNLWETKILCLKLKMSARLHQLVRSLNHNLLNDGQSFFSVGLLIRQKKIVKSGKYSGNPTPDLDSPWSWKMKPFLISELLSTVWWDFSKAWMFSVKDKAVLLPYSFIMSSDLTFQTAPVLSTSSCTSSSIAVDVASSCWTSFTLISSWLFGENIRFPEGLLRENYFKVNSIWRSVIISKAFWEYGTILRTHWRDWS